MNHELLWRPLLRCATHPGWRVGRTSCPAFPAYYKNPEEDDAEPEHQPDLQCTFMDG